jgi:hypothetical protein
MSKKTKKQAIEPLISCPEKHPVDTEEMFNGNDSYIVFGCPKCAKALLGWFGEDATCDCGWDMARDMEKYPVNDMVPVYRCVSCDKMVVVGHGASIFLNTAEERDFFVNISKNDHTQAALSVLGAVKMHVDQLNLSKVLSKCSDVDKIIAKIK